MEVTFERRESGIWMSARKIGASDWQMYRPELDHEIILRRLKLAYL